MTAEGEKESAFLPAEAQPRHTRISLTTLALMVAGISVIAAVPGNRRLPPTPRPRKTVEIRHYLGLWHEFARSTTWFGQDREAVTADYSLRPDGLIRVVNSARLGSPAGPLRWSVGRARTVPGGSQAKLKVSVLGPFWTDYWILDHAEDYAWSIISVGRRRYLRVLTRVPHPSPELRSLLFARVQSFGYDTAKLHLTVHPAA